MTLATSQQSPAEPVRGEARAPALVEIVTSLVQELNRGAAEVPRVRLDHALVRDLGLDSLSRMELLLRIEQTFDVALPSDTIETAETVGDLLRALERVPATAPKLYRVAPVHKLSVAEDERVAAGAKTLLDILDSHLAHHPDRTHIVFLSDDGEQEISYAQLATAARQVAAGLKHAGLDRGETVALMLPTGPDYFYSYFGVLLAGAIPVPIYPPARPNQIEEHVQRHARILDNAQARILITVPEALSVARVLVAHVPALRSVETPAGLRSTPATYSHIAAEPQDIAFIQYTSGSTGNPKGVTLTHANLLANVRAMVDAVRATPRDVFVSWLPLYHDMGLIGAWLGILYAGGKLVVMSPLSFLAKPERWLWAIHRFGGTLSAAPNFAYELCVKRLESARLDGLDLSSWRHAFNGAEAVSPTTIASFSERFAAYGFRPEAMTPVYGLAECSVGLLFPPLKRGPHVDRIRRDDFSRDGRAVPAAADEPHTLAFVACGRPLPEHEIRVVDAKGLEVGERVEGRLEFRGPSATSGYYRNPAATQNLLQADGWLDSGDRAYTAEGDVYITGRVKDIVIRAGRNIYPAEIEESVGALPGVRKGCVAVFGSRDPASGSERLVVLAETRETSEPARSALRQMISQAVVQVLGEPPDEIVLAPAHAVLKTSSGKIRRSACRELYDTGRIGAGTRALPWQMLLLVAGAAAPQLRRAWKAFGALLYGARVWLVFWTIAPIVWLLTACMSNPRAAWKLSQRASRVFFALAGIRFDVVGIEHLPSEGGCVVVANHASYLDGIVLVAALPRPHRFVAKLELTESFISRIYLRRLGAVFVERFSARKSIEDANRVALLATHEALAFFPEGTFTRQTGLGAFRLGAFAAATSTQVPVVPVALRGTRSVLRAGEWLPRRARIAVTVYPPIHPLSASAADFERIARLRDAARAAILEGCGEHDNIRF